MKLFWKQFIPMTCFIIISFTVFGNLMVYNSFRTTMEKETERSIEEMRIFQYALSASLQGLPKDYQATDIAIAEIVKSIQQSLNNTHSEIIIYDKQGESIYRDSSYVGKLMKTSHKKGTGIWQIQKEKEHYFLESLCEIPGNTETYQLEMHRLIDEVYEDRNQLYDVYLLTLFFVSVFSVIVLLIFSTHFTRPIRKLSHAVREFADGNYQSRVYVRGNDEVSVLSQDFNQMAVQLTESIHQLEEEARRQDEFTGAFSHELKTPLTSIIGYADMLRSRELSTEETLLSADYIFHQGRRLERLSQKMMELSYIDKQEIIFQKINATELAEQIQKITRHLLKEKEIALTIHVEKGLLWGDPDLLLSLFANLIDNARKACSDRGQIKLTGEAMSECYFFSIQDNGKGIPKEEIPKITEPFYMVDKSRARKEGGAGMGMALCKKIIRLHQTEWSILSSLDKGTTIQLFFPKKQQEVDEIENNKKEP